MDLNQLFYHHQIAVMRADGQLPSTAEDACLVGHYARRIAELRAHEGSQTTFPAGAEDL